MLRNNRTIIAHIFMFIFVPVVELGKLFAEICVNLQFFPVCYALCFIDISLVTVESINGRLQRLLGNILLQDKIVSAPPFHHAGE